MLLALKHGSFLSAVPGERLYLGSGVVARSRAVEPFHCGIERVRHRAIMPAGQREPVGAENLIRRP